MLIFDSSDPTPRIPSPGLWGATFLTPSSTHLPGDCPWVPFLGLCPSQVFTHRILSLHCRLEHEKERPGSRQSQVQANCP